MKTITEISKKVLGSYIKKASDDASYHSFQAADLNDRKVNGVIQQGEAPKDALQHDKKSFKRLRGIAKATDKLVKEEKDDKGLKKAHEKAREESKKGYVQHVERDPETGQHRISNWYDSDRTVASYQNGRRLDENVITEKNQPKKFLGKFRGTTATGQKANVVDTNPTLNQKPLRQFRIV